jgi:hypothetical protein
LPGPPSLIGAPSSATSINARGARASALASSGVRPVVSHIDPTLPEVGLAFGQDWHRRAVAMQPPGGEDMRLEPPDQQRQHGAAGAALVGQGRQAQGCSTDPNGLK